MSEVILKNELNEQIFLSVSGQNCFKWNNDFCNCMARYGYGYILGGDPVLLPIRPDEAIARTLPGALFPPQPGDDAKITSWKKENITYTRDCNIVLYNLKKGIHADILQYVRQVHPDITTATSENINELAGVISIRYGAYTLTKGEANFMALCKIPKFMTCALVTSGMESLHNLYAERHSWNRLIPYANYDYDDGNKVYRLLELMSDWGELKYTVSCARDLNLDYVQLCERMWRDVRVIDDTESRAKARAEEKVLAGVEFSANMVAELATRDKNQFDQGWIAANAALRMPSNYNVSGAQPERTSRDSCRNCGSIGHWAARCDVPYCNRCRSHWPSVTSPGYHHCNTCPSHLPVENQPLQSRGYSAGSTTQGHPHARGPRPQWTRPPVIGQFSGRHVPQRGVVPYKSPANFRRPLSSQQGAPKRPRLSPTPMMATTTTLIQNDYDEDYEDYSYAQDIAAEEVNEECEQWDEYPEAQL